jgi:hypothetical protein
MLTMPGPKERFIESATHWTDFERQNALQLRKELRAMLGYEE